MTCSSLAIPLPTNVDMIWKQILQSKSVSECADQAIWLA